MICVIREMADDGYGKELFSFVTGLLMIHQIEIIYYYVVFIMIILLTRVPCLHRQLGPLAQHWTRSVDDHLVIAQ